MKSKKYQKKLAGYELAWSDEFDGTCLDTSVWSYRALGPRFNAVVNKKAVSVEDGNLTIKVYDSAGTTYTSQIGSWEHKQFVKGYFEARIKLNEDPGASTSFWLQSLNLGKVIGRPDSSGAEIDIVEYRPIKPNKATHTVHWDGYGEHHKRDGRSSKFKTDGMYHVFAVLWDEEGYTFFVDGKKKLKVKDGISNAEEYIIFSLEVFDWAGKIVPELLPDQMQVDYVRVFQKK